MAEFGGVAEFLARYGYGPGRKNARETLEKLWKEGKGE
jgi:hypothetical protein